MASKSRFVGNRGVCLLALTLSVLDVPCFADDNDPADGSADEIEAVFRISKTFLAMVTDQELDADIPFCDTVLKFRCTGVMQGKGRLSLSLQESGTQAVFAVSSEGSAHARVRGTRGPIVTYGSAWGPFTSQTLVGFDGDEFRHIATVPSARVCIDVRRITGRHDRAAGRLFGKGVQPLAEKMIPKAIVEATPIAKRHLKEYVEETAAKIIAQLNQQTPVEETVDRLFPETRDWVFQMSADEQFMQAAFGPANAVVPELPVTPAEFQNVALEAWLLSTGDEAKLLADLSKRPLAKALVDRYLETTFPELASLADQRSVEAVGEWVVIRIGLPEDAKLDLDDLLDSNLGAK